MRRTRVRGNRHFVGAAMSWQTRWLVKLVDPGTRPKAIVGSRLSVVMYADASIRKATRGRYEINDRETDHIGGAAACGLS
jgi:hypothetical protein